MNSLAKRFDQRLVLFVLMLTLPLLFLPKVNLLSFTDETAGLRIDDLALVLASVLILVARLSSSYPLLKAERAMLIFLILSFLSVILSSISVVADNFTATPRILYAVRNAEYFAFFYVGLLCHHFLRPIRFLHWLIAVNVVVLILQGMNLVGGFIGGGYHTAGTLDGTSGLTGGHWEMGFVLGIFYAVLAFSEPTARILHLHDLGPATSVRGIKSAFYQIILFFGILFLGLLTSSRSGLIAILAVGCLVVYRRLSGLWILCLSTLAVLGLILTTYLGASDLFQNTLLARRSAGLSSLNNISLVLETYKKINVDQTTIYDAYGSLTYDVKDLDISWFIRVHKWSWAFKSFVQHPFSWALGLGPGFNAIALDGGLLRLLVENGILGSFAFFAMLYGLSKRSHLLQACVIVLLANLIFLDTYLAYKGMTIFYFVAGAYYREPLMNMVSSKRMTNHIQQSSQLTIPAISGL